MQAQGESVSYWNSREPFPPGSPKAPYLALQLSGARDRQMTCSSPEMDELPHALLSQEAGQALDARAAQYPAPDILPAAAPKGQRS